MRCIIAIWPAGPPKLSAAILAHTPTASRNEMPCAGIFDRSTSAVFMVSAFAILLSPCDRLTCARRWRASCSEPVHRADLNVLELGQPIRLAPQLHLPRP